jgi:hypothetical protein
LAGRTTRESKFLLISVFGREPAVFRVNELSEKFPVPLSLTKSLPLPQFSTTTGTPLFTLVLTLTVKECGRSMYPSLDVVAAYLVGRHVLDSTEFDKGEDGGGDL